MKIGMILDAEYPDDARITNQCEELTKYNHEVHLFENDELVEMRIYYKSSRAWGETTAIDTAEKWCLGLIH